MWCEQSGTPTRRRGEARSKPWDWVASGMGETTLRRRWELALQLFGAVRGGAGRGNVRDRPKLAKRLHMAACRHPAGSVRYRGVSFVMSDRCFGWGEATGRALAIQGAFDQDCSLYTRDGDHRASPPDRPFLCRAVGRTLVISFFIIHIQHGMIRSVGCTHQ